LLKKRGKGYSVSDSTSNEQIKLLENIAQNQHNIYYRLPFGVERIIELLLKKVVEYKPDIALTNHSSGLEETLRPSG
jgi:hypothetical protein